jgi:tol-pal system protein YbgF
MRVGQAPAADRTAAPPSGPANLAAAPAVAPPFPSAPDGNPPPQTNPPSTASAGGPVPIFGTLTPPGAAPPRPMATAVSAPAKPATASLLPVGPPDQQFDYAFKLVRKADYPAAEKALRAFVDHHPKDRLAGSAQYWLGETYFARGRYLEAAGAFAEGYKRWPNSPKAADDLLKLGVALARANQKQNACLAFGQLNHDFPHPGTAIRERVIAERHRLGC